MRSNKLVENDLEIKFIKIWSKNALGTLCFESNFFPQHLTKCPGSNQQQQQSTPVVTTPVPVPAPQVETRKTKECARCGKVLLIIGGVYARHIAKCQVSITDTSTTGKAFSRKKLKYILYLFLHQD